MLGKVFDRFVEKSPISVMVHGALLCRQRARSNVSGYDDGYTKGRVVRQSVSCVSYSQALEQFNANGF